MPKKRDLSLDRHAARVDPYLVRPTHLVRYEARSVVQLAVAVGDAARGAAGESDDVVEIGDVAVGVGRSLAARDADPRSLVDAGDGVLDLVVIEDKLQRLVTFPEELGPVTTARKGRAQRALRVTRGYSR